jgi:hypothetical protein
MLIDHIFRILIILSFRIFIIDHISVKIFLNFFIILFAYFLTHKSINFRLNGLKEQTKFIKLRKYFVRLHLESNHSRDYYDERNELVNTHDILRLYRKFEEF